MIDCIFTLDYEIYGNGDGSLKDLVYEPAEELKSIFRKWNAKFVVFAEVAELEQIKKWKSDEAIGLVERQISEFHDEGFEIGLHLHPQWYNGRYEQGRWFLDYREYNLCKLSPARIAEVADRAIEYLRCVTGHPDFVPLSFRAGNWLFQPTQNAGTALAHRGIKIDSSVFKGGRQRNLGLDYRPAKKNGYYWSFNEDVNEPDPAGQWIEVPVYTELVPSWRMLTAKRMKFKTSQATTQTKEEKLSRVLDLLRFRYPLKLDFCRMNLLELTAMVERILQEDQRDPAQYRPIVAIGHTKDFTDPGTVDAFLSFLRAKGVEISSFEAAYPRLSPLKERRNPRLHNEHAQEGRNADAEQDLAKDLDEVTTAASAPSPGVSLSYVLVTPARNEASFIEQTIKSVVGQTLRPAKWVIVSDGSTDGTDEIVGKYAAEHPWIELIRMPERYKRNFAGKAYAFNAGYARVSGVSYDVIGNLDADITFDKDYLEFLLRKFAEDPQLGVGGTPFKDGFYSYDYRIVSTEHVSGACQLFRRECFAEIGGYKASTGGGIDLMAVTAARMKGWRTRTFLEKMSVHHRAMGSSRYGQLRGAFMGGRQDYLLGCDPTWHLFRCIYRLGALRPIVLNGTLCLAGYCWAAVTRAKKVAPPDMIQFRRNDQRRRMRDLTRRALGRTFAPSKSDFSEGRSS